MKARIPSTVALSAAILVLIQVPAIAQGGPGRGPQGPGAPGGKEAPPFEEVIKEATRIEGLFDVYTKDGRYLMAIAPEQMDRDYMLSVSRETGIGQFGMLAAQVLGENPVRFRKVGNRMQFLLKNARFAAFDDAEMARAVERSFSDSLIGSAKIESQPDPKTKAVLVDMTPYFITDVEGITLFLMQAMQAQYGVDRENSSFDGVKGFPQNIEVAARVHFAGMKPVSFVNLPDSRSYFITYHYSLSTVPSAPGFIPRIADDRVGHFLALYQDFSDDRRESPYVRYVTRWNLEKEEPYAEISKPKEPIVYWLENSVPKKYRKALAEGTLMWNKAFERIGFKDAIVVKEQPDDADWDPADVRYSTVRWFLATDASFAIGPSRINPWTGQIYDADIGWSEGLVSGRRRELEELVDPVTSIQAVFDSLSGTRTAGLLRQDRRFTCELALGAMHQMAFGLDLLEARGVGAGSPEHEEYVQGFIRYVQAHEVGHTLGFRHNFRASSITPLDRLQDASLTERKGIVGSVMDYVPVNLARNGRPQGQYWQTTLGPYDYWAVEYAYKPIPGVKRPEDELPELKKIAARVAGSDHAYGTDEDTADPRTNVWDLGADPVAFYSDRADLVRELWSGIPTRLASEGESYQIMRRAFGRGMGQIGLATFNVSKVIGGLMTYRDHVGDPEGRLPMQPVPAERQREALEFLRKHVFAADAFAADPEVLNRLAASRWWDFNFTVFRLPRMEFPLHDVALAIQRNAIRLLLNPVKLDRLVDMELHFAPGEKPFTMAEMFSGLQSSIWSELEGTGPPRINSFRRAAQREHLNQLIGLLIKPEAGTPEDAGTLARHGLADLQSRIDRIAASPGASGIDAATRAHLDETRARIAAALDARMLRLSELTTRGEAS